MKHQLWSRRSFTATAALAPFGLRTALANAATSGIPVGIEMYSVRNALAKDPMGTVREVAAAGYQGLEFYAPYFAWSISEAKEMRKLLDDLGIRCFSTHNDSEFLGGEKLQHARELNLILGSKYIVMGSSHEKPGPEGWRVVADTLNAAAEKVAADGLKVGYHN